MEALSSLTPWSQLIVSWSPQLLDRRPGPYMCLFLCFMGQHELSVRQDSQTVGGTWGGGWRCGSVDEGWWASAVSSLHLHMAQCPGSAVLNDNSPASPSSQTDTPLQTFLHTTCAHILRAQPGQHTLYIHTYKHAQNQAQSTFTGRDTHLLHFA